MMLKAVRIPVWGAPEVIEIDREGGSALSGLQREVGGYIQPVDLDDTNSLYLNEDGKSVTMGGAGRGLEYNHLASTLTKGILSEGDHVVGQAVVIGLNPRSGNTVAIKDSWIAVIEGAWRDIEKAPGIRVTVPELPNCDLCELKLHEAFPAQYDAKTYINGGPWANLCGAHMGIFGRGLGVGLGQRLEVKA